MSTNVDIAVKAAKLPGMNLRDEHISAPPRAVADGKKKLIRAALKLAAEGHSFKTLGLRELGREAGLHASTFYRHFADVDALAAAAAESAGRQIMEGMKRVRLRAARHADATAGAVDYFLEFVRQNPELFRVGVRELHHSGSPVRTSIQGVLAQITEESLDQILELKLVPGLDRAALRAPVAAITHYMFCRSLDLLEQPRRRAALAAEMAHHIRGVFLGALALRKT